ncbi:hypothetical protein OTU49_005436 [Cherax quadricarinatus]|uniref:Uncharacterized protein n=1 Tax=Cherax quadricarinatus TaxID=27406 RepID=A0AAW0WTG7_CHEQU
MPRARPWLAAAAYTQPPPPHPQFPKRASPPNTTPSRLPSQYIFKPHTQDSPPPSPLLLSHSKTKNLKKNTQYTCVIRDLLFERHVIEEIEGGVETLYYCHHSSGMTHLRHDASKKASFLLFPSAPGVL